MFHRYFSATNTNHKSERKFPRLSSYLEMDNKNQKWKDERFPRGDYHQPDKFYLLNI